MNIIIVTSGEIGADFIETMTREPDVNIYFSPTTEDALRIIRSAGPETLILGQAACPGKRMAIAPDTDEVQTPPWFLDVAVQDNQSQNSSKESENHEQ